MITYSRPFLQSNSFKAALNSAKSLVQIAVSLLILITLGACNQPVGDPPETDVPRISFNDIEELTVFAVTADEFADPMFVPPEDVELTVTNQWNEATGAINILLSGADADIFAVFPAKIDNLAPGESAVITVKIAKTDPRRAVIYKVDLLVGNSAAAGKLPISYMVSPFIPDDTITVTPEVLREGNTAPTVAMASAPSESGGEWYSTNPKVAAIDKNGGITVYNAGEVIIGFLVSTENGLFQLKGKKITVHGSVHAQTIGEDGESAGKQIRLEFAEQIQPAAAIEGLSVAVNEVAVSIESISISGNTLTITIADYVDFSDTMAVTYNGFGNLGNTSGGSFKEFSVEVQNNFVDSSVDITSKYATVEASIQNGTYPGTLAVDGKADTRWATASTWNNTGNGCTLTFTYAAAVDVQKVVIAPYDNRITQFNIEYSSDNGTTWQIAYTYSGTVSGSTSSGTVSTPFVFPKVTATHFRWHILAASDQPSVWEFQLWGAAQQ